MDVSSFAIMLPTHLGAGSGAFPIFPLPNPALGLDGV